MSDDQAEARVVLAQPRDGGDAVEQRHVQVDTAASGSRAAASSIASRPFSAVATTISSG